MAIAQATQNTELAPLVSQLWHRRDNNPLWRNLLEHIKDTQYRDRWVHDHDLIVEALRRRDGDAAFVAMSNHIENVKTFLLISNALESNNRLAAVHLEGHGALEGRRHAPFSLDFQMDTAGRQGVGTGSRPSQRPLLFLCPDRGDNIGVTARRARVPKIVNLKANAIETDCPISDIRIAGFPAEDPKVQ